jgi:MoaA/NifB/PqqE/SkfB family radical SAM enzyme
MCPQGNLDNVGGPRNTGMISAETFERVVSHLVKFGYMTEYFDLYTWGEPLLNPEMGEILKICHYNGIKTVVSTNLSLPSDKVAFLTQHDVDLLLVSISGFSDKTYARNHVGGIIGLVRDNLVVLRNHRDRIRNIVLKYLVFKYNREEMALAKAFCIDNGFQFGAYMGAIPCPTSFFRYFDDFSYRRRIGEFMDHEIITSQPIETCPQENTIALNHKAELVQCCMSLHRGVGLSLFEADIDEYLNHRTENDFCSRCLSSGFCHYTHFGRNTLELLSESMCSDS